MGDADLGDLCAGLFIAWAVAYMYPRRPGRRRDWRQWEQQFQDNPEEKQP
jgi:hypothetical protein